MFIKLSDNIGLNIKDGVPLNCYYIVNGTSYNEDNLIKEIIDKAKECGWNIKLSKNRLDNSCDYKEPFMLTYKIL